MTHILSLTSGWTDDRAELARKLWTIDGYSALQIAKALGGGLSRNAVIGKLHRMGLTGAGASARMSASDLGIKTVRVRAPTRVYASRFAPALKITGRGQVFEEPEARMPRAVIPFRDEPRGLRSILTIGRCECHFPIGDPQSEDFTLCGADAPNGPYCEPHSARAFASHAARDWVDKKLAMPARARFS